MSQNATHPYILFLFSKTLTNHIKKKRKQKKIRYELHKWDPTKNQQLNDSSDQVGEKNLYLRLAIMVRMVIP